MRVSILKPNSINPEKGYTQKCGKEQSGTLLQQVELYEILKACSVIKKASEKNQNGSIFPYINNTLGKTTWTDEDGITDGVIFIDIDNITKDIADKIYNSFEDICEQFPSIYAIQFSSSYYLSESKAGLHIYIASNNLNEYEYNYQASLCLAIFARVVLNVTEIDLRTPVIGNEIILDNHNTQITQRFFLYYSEYKLNEYCEIFDESMVNSNDLQKLKSEYKTIKIIKSRKINSIVNLDAIDGNINVPKLKIDRNFFIGSDSGNNVRWKISRIAQALFGDNAKEWCDKYFYCEDNKSIYTHQNSIEGLSYNIKTWLEKNGYLTNTTPNLIKQGEYIIKYKDKITNFIDKHKRAEIIAPTGTGKTSLINGDKNYVFDLFHQSFNQFSLAHHYNAVVIVPFNVTNKLYDNMVEVSSETNNDIPEDEPCVMIWDKAIQHWGEIKNRFLIIDEAHCLFLDRNYRDKAIQLMNNLKNDNCRFVLFTATPSGEGEELKCDTLEFTNQRDSIQADFVEVDHVDKMQYNCIVNCLRNNWFDRIVLFDDMTAKKIYEKLYCDGEFIDDIAYIRADTKNTDDFKNLRDKELLTKRLTICTCVAFNGLNFKNENEKIIVITSFNNNNTTPCEIIQEAGRIRKSQVYLKVYYDNQINEDNLNNNIEKAEKLHKIESELSISEGLLEYNHKLIDNDTVNALKSIQNYINEQSTIDNILNALRDTGYFVIRQFNMSNPDDKKGNRMVLALKRKESIEFVNDLMNDDMMNKEYDEKYKLEWQNQIKHMINNDTYIGVTLETFKQYYDKSDKHSLISTIIQKIYKAINISLLDDNSWNNYANNIENVINMLGSDTIAIKQVTTSFKQNQKIRNQYKNKIKTNNNVIDLSLMFDDMIFEIADKQKQTNIAKSNGGQKGRIVCIDGIEYKTISDAANKLHTSRSQIYRLMK